ncbi:MAG: SDR family oxidoreductase [Bacteroidetes bacterium]|nr:SDR family oxidoreductase [Bacteroidota bacterium]
MILQNKVAIIHGAAGSLGGAHARTFAKEGAMVYLTGRTPATLERVLVDIKNAGGNAAIIRCDALDENDVKNCLQQIVDRSGRLDISFNAIALGDVQGTPLTEMKLSDFTRPIFNAMNTQFITGTAAGRIMKKQKSGVILSLTATPGGSAYPLVGGFGPACCAMESFSRDLAAELGPFGIRVVNMRSGGSPDSKVFLDAVEQGGDTIRDILKKMAQDTMLKKLPMMNEIANLGAFLVSDKASSLTGYTFDITCGTTQALGHQQYVIPFK